MTDLPQDGSVTITEITNSNDWNGPNGTVTYYTLKSEQVDGEFDWGKKGDPPQVGETYELEFKAGKFRPKATLAQDGGTSPSAGEKTGNVGHSSEGTDTRSAAIQRQHSAEMALRYFAGRSDLKADLNDGTLREVIDWFDDDILYGVQRASSRAKDLALNEKDAGQNGPPPSISGEQATEFLTEIKRLEIDNKDIVAKLDLLGVLKIQTVTEGVSRLPAEKADNFAKFLIAYEKHATAGQTEKVTF